MKKHLLFLYLLILMITLTTACSREIPQYPSTESENATPKNQTQETYSATDINHINSIMSFSANSSSFAFSSKDLNDNIIFSPISYAYSLGALSELTSGITRNQILSSLNISAGQTKNFSEQFELLHKNNTESTNNSKTIISNSIWTSSDYLNSDYKPILNKYNFSINHVDFNNTKTFTNMGEWFSTNSDSILHPAFKDNPSEKVSILNTTYIKSNWGKQVDITESDMFHANNGDVLCPYTYSTLYNSTYQREQTYTLTYIPLANGSKLGFVIPNPGFNIENIINSTKTLGEIITSKPTQEADITIKFPPFEVTGTFNLKTISTSLGLQNIYESKEDFNLETGLSSHLTSMVQQVTLRVDENGCNTDIVSQALPDDVPMISAPEQLELSVDKPFLFLVKGKEDIPLLIGVIRNIAV